MIYSHQVHKHDRAATTAREIFSTHWRGGIGAFLLMLVFAAVALAGSVPAFAQDAKSVAPAATNEQKAAVSSPANDQKSAGAAVNKVNINTADAQTLAANLKGVGEARAMEIVRYREAYGPFASAEELIEVKGIGPATLEMNRDAITLE